MAISFGGEERWKGRRNRARVEGNRPGDGRTFGDESKSRGENGAPVSRGFRDNTGRLIGGFNRTMRTGARTVEHRLHVSRLHAQRAEFHFFSVRRHAPRPSRRLIDSSSVDARLTLLPTGMYFDNA